MNVRYFTDPDGTEMAVLPKMELDGLRDAADHARAIADYRSGRLPGLSPAQALAFAEASSPLAFWRKHRGMTQTQLARAAGIAQSYLSELETGKRAGAVEIWLRISHVLDLPVEEIVDVD